MSIPPGSFENLPFPSSAEEHNLALQLGMIVVQGIKDVRDMEKFSGLPGTFRAEVSDTTGQMWVMTLVQV